MDAFVQHFQEYITKTSEQSIRVAAEHLVFSLRAFIRSTPNYSIEHLLAFTESFITIQLAHFEQWCEEIPTMLRKNL